MDFLKNKIIKEDLQQVYERDIPWDKLRNKTILITGACGMLASYVTYMCIFLNEVQDFQMTIIPAVRSENKFKKRFGIYAEKEYMKPYYKDINQAMELEGVDFIIHGASLASSQYYGTMPIEVILPNVLGTIELLKLAEKCHSEAFLLFSSGEVYGKISGQHTEITEDLYGASDTLNIRNCYCESKRMAEMLCYAWYVQKQIPVKIARIFHTYGPTMNIEEDQRVFASFVKNVIDGNDIVMKSTGAAKRPFCYLADAVDAYFRILLNGVSGEAYNVSNAKEFISIRELADIMVQLYPEKGLSVVVQLPDEEKERLDNKSVGDIVFSDKKLKALGWKCRYNSKEGFYRTIEGILAEG